MKSFLNKENNMIRGIILRALQVNYPHPVGDQLLAEILLDAQYQVTPHLVSGYLTYLEDKGYIVTEVAEEKTLKIYRKLARLTPHGVDLLDGNIEADPGVRLS